MPNIEIKARTQNLANLKEVAKSLATSYLGLDHQVDTYFQTTEGRFKLRESTIKGAYLIPYLRPDTAGPKKSDYAMISVTDGSKVRELFTKILGVIKIIKKQRDIYLIGNVRVHLDEVENLGTFLEFEAAYENPADESAEKNKVNQLLLKFGIKDSDLITHSYSDF